MTPTRLAVSLGRATIAALLVLLPVVAGDKSARAHHSPPYEDGVLHQFGDEVDYPLVFPVGGEGYHYADDQWIGFWACRDGCASIHHAIDFMADKMVEVYAAAAGTVTWLGSTCCSVFLTHDDGWETWYIHLNNDTPGTDDGQGWGIAPGIEIGARVEAGQLIGWVGDSGNAENTPPHLHFELRDPEDTIVNPFLSLGESEAARGFSCAGRPATRVDTNGDHSIVGTPYADVIVGTPYADYLTGGLGDDILCGRGGDDTIDGNDGNDEIQGNDGDDTINGGRGSDLLMGDIGDDVIRGGSGHDRLQGGEGDDILNGGAGHDVVAGGPGDDLVRGAGGNDELSGGDGSDRLLPDAGDDTVDGGEGRDRLYGGSGRNVLNGGTGRDVVVYARATGPVLVDLAAGIAAWWADDILAAIEVVVGSSFDDDLTGNATANALRGLGGSDMLDGAEGDDVLVGGTGHDQLRGSGGDDLLVGGNGDDLADGGEGTDTCDAETLLGCEN